MIWFWRAVFTGIALAALAAGERGGYAACIGWLAGLVALYFVRAYLWPYVTCSWCDGKKTRPGSTRRRYGPCFWCKGTGSRQVLGSRLAHKAVRSLRDQAWRSK